MSLDFTRILLGLVCSTAIGGLAYWKHSLSRSGWFGAVLTGTLTFGFGGWLWGLTLIAFFISSSALSHFKQAQKQRIAGEKFEKGGQRDLGQVLANGGLGALLALIFGLSGEPQWLLALYTGVMATVTADTWATEIGVLSPHQPRMILSGKLVEPGTSGGVTPLGLAATFAGALFIGLMMIGLSRIELGLWNMWLLPVALLGGVVGCLLDSAFGASLQAMYRTAQGQETEREQNQAGEANQRVRGLAWMNNDMVNGLSSLLGGVCAVLVSWLF